MAHRRPTGSQVHAETVSVPGREGGPLRPRLLAVCDHQMLTPVLARCPVCTAPAQVNILYHREAGLSKLGPQSPRRERPLVFCAVHRSKAQGPPPSPDEVLSPKPAGRVPHEQPARRLENAVHTLQRTPGFQHVVDRRGIQRTSNTPRRKGRYSPKPCTKGNCLAASPRKGSAPIHFTHSLDAAISSESQEGQRSVPAAVLRMPAIPQWRPRHRTQARTLPASLLGRGQTHLPGREGSTCQRE